MVKVNDNGSYLDYKSTAAALTILDFSSLTNQGGYLTVFNYWPLFCILSFAYYM